ncbi:MAG TPA: choice-of-anchor tandem repeat GloVer-containing protein [Terriglobales bacterium]|nr:choice-of-anchor tandem repeat GloVer-containing protein [Terriglobales bacterium]
MAGPGQYEGYKTAERRGSNRVLALIALLSSLALVQSAQAQTFTVLHSFEASFSFDGEYPDGSLIADSSGNLYGSTYWGGDYNFGAGFGTLFTVNASTGYLQMYEFTGTSGGNFVDGANPFAGLVAGKSNMLFGTTYDGGASGYGIVFTFNLDGKEETVLYNFAGGKDGAFPTGALIVDANGNLYGTTAEGGRFGLGTIFKAGTAGKKNILHSFAGGATDGQYPLYTSLVRDAAGDLYGVTEEGGTAGVGTLYELSHDGTFKLLHSFAGGALDGCHPFGTPFIDKNGNIYGTTFGCGSSSLGTVWRVQKDGTETLLHNFAGGKKDGAEPLSGVLGDAAGNLYGNTELGGASNEGTVYAINAKGKLSLLHSFAGSDGAFPVGGMVREAQGTLYGTTFYGGDFYFGTVWQLTK